MWKLTLSYDGSDFHGWQIQPNLPTVQGTLAKAIRSVTGEDPLPQGSGRTDTGVHAIGQVASFALTVRIPPANLLRALNRALPPSIRIFSAEVVPEDFHARHSALRKTYEYRIFPRVSTPAHPGCHQPDRICPPAIARYVWDCPWYIDLDAARQVCQHLHGEHDFASFAASDPDFATRATGEPRNSVRTIFRSSVHTRSGLLIYRVTGSGFLHHMVRNIVGTLVEAASGRIALNSIPLILAARDRSTAGPTAPAAGLFLMRVDYPRISPPSLSLNQPLGNSGSEPPHFVS